ncbi:hypothetical protein [Ralstonia insidiosa]|jgi:hypothetical protein|uniref:hypothetical protein n=1 Tax=Ralstonia insidiosa TaxID=190721 RepID=UPI000386B85C|nr:hypothetical protein [Ralstonia insidiosa]EPX95434.1 hypothetical protein C404_23915 [Ralstonia sp. AU12-08]
MSVNLYVIYSRGDRVLLSRQNYESWQQIQEEVADYMTSLGPWSVEETVDYLNTEHPGLEPSAAEQVRALMVSTESIASLRFKQA